MPLGLGRPAYEIYFYKEPMSQNRYYVLDGIRGVAAIGVMIGHIVQGVSTSIFSCGLAVDIFFILSGFVLSCSYSERVAAGLSHAQFMRIRLVRIYPMYLFGLLLGAPVLYVCIVAGYAPNFTSADVARTVIKNGIFFPYLSGHIIASANNHANTQIVPVNDPLWSIIFEMAASLAFISLCKLKKSSLLALSIISFCATFLYGAVYSILVPKGRMDFELGWGNLTFVGGFARVMYGFALGMYIFHVLPAIRKQRWASIYSRVKASPYILYGLTLIVLTNTWTLQGFFTLIGMGILAPCIIIAGALSKCEGKISIGIAKFLGWISYPLYCVHYPLLRLAKYIYLTHPTMNLSLAEFTLSLASVSILLAIIVGKFYDEPIRRYFSHDPGIK